MEEHIVPPFFRPGYRASFQPIFAILKLGIIEQKFPAFLRRLCTALSVAWCADVKIVDCQNSVAKKLALREMQRYTQK